jgi:hypothetical protein
MLGEAWLIPALALGLTFITVVVVPSVRWTAKRWRRARDAERAARIEAQNEAKELQGRYSEEMMARMFLEARLEACERELENWKSGRWTQR